MQHVAFMLAQDLPCEADDIERELATLAAHLDAATHRMLALVRRFDELGAWAAGGARSCAHWLSWRIGLAPGAARERVRVAHALGSLPRIDDALRTGRLSYSKVRAMTRVANAENEGALCEMALCATAAQLERICRGVAVVDSPGSAGAHGERDVSARALGSGLVRITADLHPDEAALVMKAVEAARHAGVATAVGQHVPAGTSCAEGVAESTSLPTRADGLVQVAEAFLAADDAEPRSGAEHRQVVVTLGPDALDGRWRAELEDGTHVPAETLRRVACDCALAAVVTSAGGDIVASGRRTRVIPAPLRRALALRDPCCRFPGCTNRLGLDAHHVRHWAHGGETSLENLASTCRPHHRLLHEGGFTVAREGDDLVFRTPDGRVLEAAPRPPALAPDPIAALCATQVALAIDDQTGLAPWDGRAPDYSACVAAAQAPFD